MSQWEESFLDFTIILWIVFHRVERLGDKNSNKTKKTTLLTK